MGELTLAQSTGEVFATQFFSARKLKFILFLRSADAVGGAGSILEHWRALAETFKGSALFAYMVNAGVPDVRTELGGLMRVEMTCQQVPHSWRQGSWVT